MHRSKFITVLLIISILFSLASCGENQPQEETIKVGMECNYAPFNWTQSNETATSVPIDSVPGAYADGYDVQMARKIAEGLGKKLVIVKLEWDGLTPALVAGEIDLIIAGMSPTAERKLTIDFTDAYYASELVVVVRKDSQFAGADSLDDFAGAVITGQLNTVHYDVIDQMEGVMKENAMETFPAMIVALTSGKIDGYVSELPGAVSAAAANSDLTYVRFAEGQGFVAAEEDITVAVGVRKGETELVNSINNILAGISGDERQKMMQDAVSNQPLSDM